MGNKHKYYDVIVAWAGGEKIQCNDSRFQSKWNDYDSSCTPDFCDGYFQWRIKPKTITKKYRMALVATPEFNTAKNVISVDITNTSIDDPAEYNVPGFIRWVGEPVEVEIEA